MSLEDALASGDRLVLAFYFEDETPTCETEVSVLKDSHEMLREFRARAIAISADTVESHERFAQRLGGVPFPLASDESLDVARAYGVVDEGDPRRSRRAVFVIDTDATILLAIVPFQPGNLAHVEAIFNTLGAET